MNLRVFLSSLARRWWVVLIGVVATGAVAVGLYTIVPVSYTASATVVLLPPKTLYGEGGNPYLYLGGLSQAVDVLTRKLAADETSEPIADANPGASFEVYGDTSSSGPIVVITATGDTPAHTLKVMEDVLAATPVAMQQLQVELAVAADSLITLKTLAIDEEPKVDNKTRLQAVLGAAGAGLIATLALAALVDNRLLARRSRRDTARDAEVTAARAEPVEEPAAAPVKETARSGMPAPVRATVSAGRLPAPKPALQPQQGAQPQPSGKAKPGRGPRRASQASTNAPVSASSTSSRPSD